ncbi:MAG TPA: DoxX family protein [Steroidobacteraceae bacterium]
MQAPIFVRKILDSPATALGARIALTAAFWASGFLKLSDFSGAVAEVRHFGLEPAQFIAAATIVVQLGGSALIILSRAVWLGAGALAVFTLLATLQAHAFWSAPAAVRAQTLNIFLEHIGLIGGFVLVAILATRASATRRGPS